VNPDRWRAMEDVLRPIPFLAALERLQGMLGSTVSVQLNDYGSFFGCGFEGTLERVESMPPGDRAIRVVLSGGAGFFLDPNQVMSFLSEGTQGLGCLEFQSSPGPGNCYRADLGDQWCWCFPVSSWSVSPRPGTRRPRARLLLQAEVGLRAHRSSTCREISPSHGEQEEH
jgi:hypothetical protein